MYLYIPNGSMLFCIAFGMLLLTTFIMGMLSKSFYTQDVVLRRFSIIDLEFPSSPLELANLIQGIFRLPADHSQKVLRSLKSSLTLDFLFMPAAYGGIFLACMKVSSHMVSFGHEVFGALAWLQLLPWLLDIIENIYFFSKLHPGSRPQTVFAYRAFTLLEILKWGTALTGMVCAIAAMMYFWLVGQYSTNSLIYMLITIAEIFVFIIASKMTSKKLQHHV